MAQFQPHATTHSLDDIWSTLGGQYSSCCVHIINHGKDWNMRAIETPILLSHCARPRPIPSEFLHALRTVKCLLTILSLSISERNKNYIIEMLDKDRAWGLLQRVSPQTYIIHASAEDDVAWLDSDLLSQLELYHWPEIFVLQQHPVAEKTLGTYRI